MSLCLRDRRRRSLGSGGSLQFLFGLLSVVLRCSYLFSFFGGLTLLALMPIVNSCVPTADIDSPAPTSGVPSLSGRRTSTGRERLGAVLERNALKFGEFESHPAHQLVYVSVSEALLGIIGHLLRVDGLLLGIVDSIGAVAKWYRTRRTNTSGVQGVRLPSAPSYAQAAPGRSTQGEASHVKEGRERTRCRSPAHCLGREVVRLHHCALSQLPFIIEDRKWNPTSCSWLLMPHFLLG
jgi:hypothetical protein